MFCRLLSLLFLSLLWLHGGGPVCAQRVQFPSAAQTITPAPNITPAPTYAPPPATLPGFDPYGNPLLGTPPADVPYNAAPQFAPAGAPAPIGPAPGVAQPPYPQSGNSIYPSGVPYQWESGAYQYQNSDGSVVRLQRLLQQISFEHTWIYGEDSFDTLGINRSELSATFGFPIFYNPNTPLLITPGFAFNWFDGPVTPLDPNGIPLPGSADLPPRVYDAYIDASWYPQLSDWLHADLGLRTGVWTDFNVVNSDSVRILGRGLGVMSFSPQMDILLGVWYLDRNRVKLLPAGGVHWRPSPNMDAYLVFPNPKLRMRSHNVGSSQWWMYFAGEYGGGRWTLERASGASDDIDYNDIRLIFGVEWETQTQTRGHFEIGYVFDREILYAETMSPPKLELDESFMFRAGFDF